MEAPPFPDTGCPICKKIWGGPFKPSFGLSGFVADPSLRVIRSISTYLRQCSKEMNRHPQAVVATTTSNESTTLPFVIPSEAEESAVSASQYQMLTGETVLFIPSSSTCLRQVYGAMNIANVDYGNVSTGNELSSRPKRSVVEGPAVSWMSIQFEPVAPFCSSGAANSPAAS
jgi:hypothetical protein